MSLDDVAAAVWHSPSPRPVGVDRDRGVAWWRSIRFRLALTFAAVAFLLIGSFGLLAARVVLDSARDQQRSIAAEDLQAAVASYVFSQEINGNLSVGAADVPVQLRRVLRPGVFATWDDGTRLWAARELSDGTVLSAHYADAPVLDHWRSLRNTILRLALVVAVVASGAGWLLATGLTRRIRSTARAAGRIRAGDLLVRADASGGDEVAALAAAVNGLTDELLQRLDQERALTADAAHELRTPLTALVSATELLEEGRDADRVRHQTQRLRHLIEDVLRLARLESEPGGERSSVVDLETFAADVVEGSAYASDCRLVTLGSAMVRVDSGGARRVIENLIANCEYHGQAPVELTIDGAMLTITDCGPGYPQDLLTHGPRRFRPSGLTGRSGLGLTIVVRELQAMGATLTLANSERGAVSTITFGRA